MPRRLFVISLLALCAEAQFGGGQTCGFPCARGRYCVSQWRRGCKACAAGKYSRDRDLTFCTVCVPGRYQPRPGASACSACPASKFQPAHRSRHCYPCRAGRTSREGATSCDAVLPAAKASAQAPHGRATRAPKAGGLPASKGVPGIPPKPSVPPKPQKSAARSGCQRGQALVKRGIGGHGCQNCPSGHYGSADLRCVACPPGRFQPYGAKPQCFPCGEGQFSDEHGATLCLPTQCGAGQHQVAVTSAGCATCARGWFQPAANKLSCKRCDCGSGRYRRVSTPLRCECAQCPVGQHQVAPGVARCALCPSGRFQAAKGKLKCTSCPSGRFTSLRGDTCDGACPAGAYKPKARATAPAYVAAAAWGTSDDGTNDRGEGSAHVRGYGAAAEDTRRGCFACPVGKHSVVTNAKECQACACEPGKYQQRSGKAGPSGFVIYGSDNKAQSPKQPGLFAQCICVQCPAGKHQRHFNRARCALCGAGAFQPKHGQARCEACPAGKFSNHEPHAPKNADGRGHTRGTACSNCGIGQYQSQMGQARCEWCVPPKKKKKRAKQQYTAQKSMPWRESTSRARRKVKPPVMVISSSGAECFEACPAGRYRNKPHKALPKQVGHKPEPHAIHVPHCSRAREALQCACKKWATPSACSKFSTTDVCFAPCCGCPDMASAMMQQRKHNAKRRRLAAPGRGTPSQRCLACPPGKFRLQPKAEHRWAGVSLALSESQLRGTSSCATCSCPRGRFQYSVERCHCTACPDGKFNRFKGSYYCFPCPKGKWSRTMPTDLMDPLHSRYRFYSVTKCTRISKLSLHRKHTAPNTTHHATAPGKMALGKPLLLLVQPGHAGQAFRNKLGQRCAAGRYLAVRGHDLTKPSSIQIACLLCAKGRYREAKEARTNCKSCVCPTGRWQRDTTACKCDKQLHEELSVKQKERLRLEEKTRMKQYEKAEKAEARSEAKTKGQERGKRARANEHIPLPSLRVASDDDDSAALKAAAAASRAKIAGSTAVAAARRNPSKSRITLPTWLGPLVTPIVIGLVVMPVLGMVVCANAATKNERERNAVQNNDDGSHELAGETVGIAALGGQPYSSDMSMLVMDLSESSGVQRAKPAASDADDDAQASAEHRRKKRASKPNVRSQGHGSSMQVAPDGSLLLNGRRAFGFR